MSPVDSKLAGSILSVAAAAAAVLSHAEQAHGAKLPMDASAVSAASLADLPPPLLLERASGEDAERLRGGGHSSHRSHSSHSSHYSGSGGSGSYPPRYGPPASDPSSPPSTRPSSPANPTPSDPSRPRSPAQPPTQPPAAQRFPFIVTLKDRARIRCDMFSVGDDFVLVTEQGTRRVSKGDVVKIERADDNSAPAAKP
jgi:hypothetical protein